jgi:phosphomannomutase
METLVEAFSDATLEELDGITLDSGDWWCNVRASNTEPLLRLNLEGPNAATVDAKVAEVAEHLAHLGKMVDH